MITRSHITVGFGRTFGLVTLALLLLGIVGPTCLKAQSDSTRTLAYRYFDQAVLPERYIIRPQEKLTVNFVGTKLAPLDLMVGADGRLVDASLGIFDLAGKTLADTRELLIPEIKKAYTAERIEITVGAPYQLAVALTGAVPKPGWYLGFTSNLVSELIDLADGILPSGSRRHIKLLGGPAPVPVDLDRAVYLGQWEANPPLYAGNRIHVPERSDRTVHVVGEVLQPREIELLEGDSVGLLIAMAGGMSETADREHIHFSNEPTRFITGAAVPEAGQVIVVPPLSDFAGGGTVSLFGAVTQPGRYPLPESQLLSDLLSLGGGAEPRANEGRITVFRQAPDKSPTGGVRVRYPISTVGQAGTFTLQAGDSVFVPETVGFVRVEGRVRNPGLVPWAAGKTVQYYVQLAGGFLDDANREEIDITDRISRLSNRGGPGSGVGDGDQILVRRKEPGQ